GRAAPCGAGPARATPAWARGADGRSPDPPCSAIRTRSSRAFEEFPAWFFNLPPPNESWPQPSDIPPGAPTPMHVRGYLTTTRPGTLDFEGASGVTGTGSLDGQVKPWPMQVAAGPQATATDTVHRANKWR